MSAIEHELAGGGEGDEDDEDDGASGHVLHQVPGNELCCDCGEVRPEWASINLGIYSIYSLIQFVYMYSVGVYQSRYTHMLGMLRGPSPLTLTLI